jgi:putative phosphoribosyl transferase
MDSTETVRFRDRAHAGRLLAQRLRGDYAGRGDTIVVRKRGIPGHEGYALGAIASGGTRVLNRAAIDRLGIPAEWMEATDAKERRELERREREDEPARIVVAVPVADSAVHNDLRRQVDEVLSPATPSPFGAVGAWYEDFSQTSDADVREPLSRAIRPLAAAAAGGVRRLTGDPEDYDELPSRYFHARLADQSDAMIRIDETQALEPLKRTSEWEAGELSVTYPWGV